MREKKGEGAGKNVRVLVGSTEGGFECWIDKERPKRLRVRQGERLSDGHVFWAPSEPKFCKNNPDVLGAWLGCTD
jgi:hypothetical protein